MEPVYETAAEYVGAAARALTEVEAEPERIKIYHNGDVYLDLPLVEGRLICPVKVKQGLWQFEIWGKYQNLANRCLHTSEPFQK